MIPARWDSTRFSGKVLADINGKPMIQHVWEAVARAREIEDVLVAVDKDEVFEVVKSFGGKAVYTSASQPSGSDRLAEAVHSLDADIIVNIQADEPMVHPLMVDELAMALKRDRGIQMATLIKKIDKKDEMTDPNVVKVVTDKKGFALYFSRSPIGHFKHIGMYAYTKDFLFVYTNLPKSPLEENEKLEQLRVLEHGYKIKTIETKYDTIGVDTPEDLEKVRELMAHGIQTG